MKILITGGAGFIGSHLAECYVQAGHKVIVVDNLSHPVKDFSKIFKNVKFQKTDIENIKLLKKIFKKEKPQIVNHHAAQSSVSSKGEGLFKTNVLGTINLLQLSLEFRVKKFIFASSAAVYGEAKSFPIKEDAQINPLSEYGISKALAEHCIRLYNKDFQTIIFRYSNVYGPRQDSTAEGGVVAIFENNIKNNKKSFIYGDGKQTRDFINVKDIAAANIKATDLYIEGVFNISSNKEIKIIELYKIIAGKNKNKFEYLSKRTGEIKRSILDHSLATKKFNWKPTINLI